MSHQISICIILYFETHTEKYNLQFRAAEVVSRVKTGQGLTGKTPLVRTATNVPKNSHDTDSRYNCHSAGAVDSPNGMTVYSKIHLGVLNAVRY